ncbi:hypothetical protein [Sphingomonas sp. BAUL-RG-20F-R05-02]|uniref:hypothetical protein n=1 Tax=Sphingomonas sp. BAUL-RG-20F-R05-02 TaxID=2914830 RepID=UPI001F564E9C|nr:hypothetical protein [Sphingomonas sp. BAUL-RG-20F-R05-02]
MSDSALQAFYSANRALMQFMKKNASARHISVFLHVAMKDSVDLKALTKMVGGKPGTVYDDLQDLGKVSATGRTGYNLVEEVKPAVEGGAYLYRLTGRGRMALEAMAFQMNAYLAPHVDDEDDKPLEAYWDSRAVVRG